MNPTFEPILGRYLHLELDGVSHRVYVEEAGTGVPLLCLHTAGADTRQFRGLLKDDTVLRSFRVIAFDLPWHGKSSPPPGWERTEYQLTTQAYVTVILGVADALGLDRPVAIGCSIGGRVVLHLARRHPERFGAVIGLQSGPHVAPYYDVEWLNRPDVHGGEVCAAVVSGLIGPDAPEEDRWETLWHYMQGGPGVFKGDLFFYKQDGDIREELALIDADSCPVFLLSGEYDYSATPEDSAQVAAAVAGSHFTRMEGLGHFPMSEHYERFREYLLPVLDAALEARARPDRTAAP
jgi:pimeloyl-ACP methyl ester carboxylesterase